MTLLIKVVTNRHRSGFYCIIGSNITAFPPFPPVGSVSSSGFLTSVAFSSMYFPFFFFLFSVAARAYKRCTLPSLNTREPSGVSANSVPTPISAVATPKTCWAARAISEPVSSAIASAVHPARKIKTLSAVTPRLVLRASYGLPREPYLCAQDSDDRTSRVTMSGVSGLQVKFG